MVFHRTRVAVFCDGDFWHGRHLAARVAKLAAGHNAPYWVAKITANEARDRRHDEALAAAGWTVLRYWESDVLADADAVARAVYAAVIGRGALAD
jgi:DNA mismatch endonuclease (patch repair protein)